MIHRSCCGFGPLPTVLCYFTSSQCSRFPISVPSIHLPAVYITQVLHTHSSPEHCYNLSGSYTLRPTKACLPARLQATSYPLSYPHPATLPLIPSSHTSNAISHLSLAPASHHLLSSSPLFSCT